MLNKNLFTVNATGLDSVTLRDDVNGNVQFIRQALLEQREADLLKQLETAEDTVDVLEKLLVRYAAEIRSLRAQNLDMTERSHFIASLKRASAVVDTWPEWKKMGLSRVLGC